MCSSHEKYFLIAAVSALEYEAIEDGDAHRVVVGLGNGQIHVSLLLA